jgi:chromosomal replication initiation ATPase DnaA
MGVMGDERILGSSDFVETVLKKANENYERRARFRAKGLRLEEIIDAVAGYFGVTRGEKESQRRPRVVRMSPER